MQARRGEVTGRGWRRAHFDRRGVFDDPGIQFNIRYKCNGIRPIISECMRRLNLWNVADKRQLVVVMRVHV
jgi:hypothetical protein